MYNRHIIVIFYALGDGSSTVQCSVHCDVNDTFNPMVRVYLRTICDDPGVNSDPGVQVYGMLQKLNEVVCCCLTMFSLFFVVRMCRAETWFHSC